MRKPLRGLQKNLLIKSRDLTSIEQSGSHVLFSEEYRIRAELLVEARRLVGGVVLEIVEK